MTQKELQEYIAVQALCAILHGDTMATDQAIASEDVSDAEANEWLEEVTDASIIIAKRMTDKLRNGGEA